MTHPFRNHFIVPSGRIWSVVTLAILLTSLLLAGNACGGSSSLSSPPPAPTVVVTSLDDVAQPPAGTITLRTALDQAASGEAITFAPALNGGTIDLSIIGESHSILLGEVYSGMAFQGYSERDYGKSALYVKKDVVLDATSLPAGLTIRWTGGDANPARVLAVYGNLTLRNISITGGYSLAEAISGSSTQPYTLARGGGLAVWGTATLENCAVYGNKIVDDTGSSRDRGTYGGGIYANGLRLRNCIVSGNTAWGYGAAGGGIYSVGGADNTNVHNKGNDTFLSNCVISGNRVTAQHAYGGGVFTLSGGPNNLATMTVTNCTIARNVAEDNPDIPDTGQWYKRGGGIYMGGGSLQVISSTIAENEINGTEAMFGGKSNMGGGGVAATIGNAHVVEDATVQHSIVIGNKKNGAPEDWFAGSVINFYSNGYNRIGFLDFGQILVPCPEWNDLSRKHYPEPGDIDSLNPGDVLDLSAIHYHPSILSAGTDAGGPAVMWYSPGTAAVNQIPTAAYTFDNVSAGYTGYSLPTDDFLNHVLDKLRADDRLGSDFESDRGDMTGTTWYGPAKTWPRDPQNAAWIAFWRKLDTDINGRLGTGTLNDAFWGTYQTGPLDDNVSMTVLRKTQSVQLITGDQLGHSRPSGGLGDVGAIEK